MDALIVRPVSASAQKSGLHALTAFASTMTASMLLSTHELHPLLRPHLHPNCAHYCNTKHWLGTTVRQIFEVANPRSTLCRLLTLVRCAAFREALGIRLPCAPAAQKWAFRKVSRSSEVLLPNKRAQTADLPSSLNGMATRSDNAIQGRVPICCHDSNGFACPAL